MGNDRAKPAVLGLTRWCCLFAVLACAGCAGRSAAPPPPAEWTNGFWFWNGSYVRAAAAEKPVDVLYCQVGTLERSIQYPGNRVQWYVRGRLPDSLPAARSYWLVFRFESQGVPALETVPELSRLSTELLAAARRRGLNAAGIQLDIDSPTRALQEYARFLRELKKSLAPEVPISITALLDWFRPGTSVESVVEAADEFVPQFYDVQAGGRGEAIAAPIDAAKWGPVFNRFQRRFRIGISTFGRARFNSRTRAPVLYGDLKPTDIGALPGMRLEESRTEARELVLRYRAERRLRIEYADLDPGDALEFTLATPESIRLAVEQARRMGAYCAGAVFFRWPARGETLAAQLDDVLAAASARTPPPPRAAALEIVDGDCASVYCVDLYLNNTSVLTAETRRYAVISEASLEYFLPNKKLPVRMAAPARIELTLPPHGGEAVLFLGRAVLAERAGFRLEEKR